MNEKPTETSSNSIRVVIYPLVQPNLLLDLELAFYVLISFLHSLLTSFYEDFQVYVAQVLEQYQHQLLLVNPHIHFLHH